MTSQKKHKVTNKNEVHVHFILDHFVYTIAITLFETCLKVIATN